MPTTATAPVQGSTISDAPRETRAVSKRHLLHAVVFRVQKERRHVEARRVYFARIREADDAEQLQNFNTLRFAADELRRARTDLEELIAEAITGGVTE